VHAYISQERNGEASGAREAELRRGGRGVQSGVHLWHRAVPRTDSFGGAYIYRCISMYTFINVFVFLRSAEERHPTLGRLSCGVAGVV